MPDIVIVNTSPIFYLHRVQQLELFNKLYKTVTVPIAVVKELELYFILWKILKRLMK